MDFAGKFIAPAGGTKFFAIVWLCQSSNCRYTYIIMIIIGNCSLIRLANTQSVKVKGKTFLEYAVKFCWDDKNFNFAQSNKGGCSVFHLLATMIHQCKYFQWCS